MPSEISFEYADINSLIPYALNSRTHIDLQPLGCFVQRLGISKILMPHEIGIAEGKICCFF